MRGIIFTSLALAVAVRNALNTRAGCPIAPDHIGASVPPGLGVTTRVSGVRKHPTLNRWAVLVTKPRLLIWWLAVKQAAQDRITASPPGTAQDQAIVATNVQDANGAWDGAGEVA
jgi:hypothetical protein